MWVFKFSISLSGSELKVLKDHARLEIISYGVQIIWPCSEESLKAGGALGGQRIHGGASWELPEAKISRL